MKLRRVYLEVTTHLTVAQLSAVVAAVLFGSVISTGPGVCVWLALSELMPTRIRSNGMSIARVINQLVSTAMAGIFLPFVGKYGYANIFLLFAGFTLVYFLIALFLLLETKGKTLEQIEALVEENE
jgi:MFS transporter, SP family, solute carrier family 2 (myo-inositol transporter), member 13